MMTEMTGEELKTRRTLLGLTQREMAEALQVSPNTVARWEREEMGMPGMIALALERLEAEAAPRKSANSGKKKRLRKDKSS